jgi:hypothetical protein
MPDVQIANPAGVFGLTASPASPTVVSMVNNSGGTLVQGDVVVLSTDVTGCVVTTSTGGNDFTVIGVVGGHSQGALGSVSDTTTFPNGGIVPVIIQGPARVNIGANTVAAGAQLTSDTNAKQAKANAASTVLTAVGTIIGIALEAQSAKDANNTIRAWIQKM